MPGFNFIYLVSVSLSFIAGQQHFAHFIEALNGGGITTTDTKTMQMSIVAMNMNTKPCYVIISVIIRVAL